MDIGLIGQFNLFHVLIELVAHIHAPNHVNGGLFQVFLARLNIVDGIGPFEIGDVVDNACRPEHAGAIKGFLVSAPEGQWHIREMDKEGCEDRAMGRCRSKPEDGPCPRLSGLKVVAT